MSQLASFRAPRKNLDALLRLNPNARTLKPFQKKRIMRRRTPAWQMSLRVKTN